MSSVGHRHGNTTLRYRREVQPLVFPSGPRTEDEIVGESKRHLLLRIFLFQLLRQAFADRCAIGCDQFVYWNARDPRRVCAPDVFVKLGQADDDFAVWKTWERGAPELVVEILSPSDRELLTWEEKLERFHELGVAEVVRFDPDAPAGARLRVWDRVEGDLVERAVEGDATPCLTLALHWVIAPVEGIDGLRLARDPAGRDLLLRAAPQ